MSYPYDDYEIEVFESEGGAQVVREENEELETEHHEEDQEKEQIEY